MDTKLAQVLTVRKATYFELSLTDILKEEFVFPFFTLITICSSLRSDPGIRFLCLFSSLIFSDRSKRFHKKGVSMPEIIPVYTASPSFDGQSLPLPESREASLVALKILSLLGPLDGYQRALRIERFEDQTYGIWAGRVFLLFKVQEGICGVLVNSACLSSTPACAVPFKSDEYPEGDLLVSIDTLEALEPLQNCFLRMADEVWEQEAPNSGQDSSSRSHSSKKDNDDQFVKLNTLDALAVLSRLSPEEKNIRFVQPDWPTVSLNLSSSAARASQIPVEKASLSAGYCPFLMYAFIQNDFPSFEDIQIANWSTAPLEHLRLTIESRNEILGNAEYPLPDLPVGSEIEIRKIELDVLPSTMTELASPLDLTFDLCLYEQDSLILKRHLSLRILPFDQWGGTELVPQMLAAFSIPSHPAVTMLMQQTSKILANWNEDVSLEGYQSGSPDRVKTLAAAAYAAIQQQNITYAMPPSSFGFQGQRIRLPDAVLDEHMGTCLDMTMLYASLLEAIGLNPILILVEGHIFAGVWLVDHVFESSVMTDPSLIEKLCEPGVRQMVLVETTSMNAGRSVSFEESGTIAMRTLHKYYKFEFALDVQRIRYEGIRPLPVRVRQGDQYILEHEERKEEELTDRPDEIGEVIDFASLSAQEEKITRLSLWQRKLLDLSLRNPLISLRFSSSCIPLLSTNVAKLEDTLYESGDFEIVPRAETFEADDSLAFVSPEFFRAIEPMGKLLDAELKSKRILTLLKPGQLAKSLTTLFRSSKSAMEETGSNTLFLALGLLRYIAPTEKTARYAPIILVPISLKRKAGSNRFTLSMRDEDSQVNITLLEYLRQTFNLKIPDLVPPPKDEFGLDIPKIFAIIRHAILNLHMFSIVDAACLSSFSFAQFPMYADMRNNSEFLKRSSIVRSLLEQHLEENVRLKDESGMNGLLMASPLDSSQRKALLMAEKGCDFVLHGPPGTGKSQTITAMIANLLGKGQTVLFAAEKMAALEVVQKRLEELGLSRYILELHSTKATRKAILARMKEALEKTQLPQGVDLQRKLEETRELSAILDGYDQALKKRRSCGMSIADLISLYQNLDPDLPELSIDPNKALAFTDKQTDRQLAQAEYLETLIQGLPDMNGSPFLRIQASLYTSTLEDSLENMLTQSLDALKALRDQDFILNERYGFPKLFTYGDFSQADELGAFCIRLSRIKPWQLDSNPSHRQRIYDKVRQKTAAKDQKNQIYQRMLERWSETVLHLRVDDLERQYLEAQTKLIGRKKAMTALCAVLSSYARFPISEETFLSCCREIEDYQHQLAASPEPAMNPYAVDGHTAWLAEQARSIDAAAASILQPQPAPVPEPASKEKEEDVSSSIDPEDLPELMRETESFWTEYGNLLDVLRYTPDTLPAMQNDVRNFAMYCSRYEQTMQEVMRSLNPRFDADEPDFAASYEAFVHALLTNRIGLKDWMLLRNQLDTLYSLGMDELIDACLKNGLRKNLRLIWLKSLARTIIRYTIDQDPSLRNFASGRFEKVVEQFGRLDQERMELTAREISLLLARNLPTDQESPKISAQLNILRKAIASGGRGLSIRTLFTQIPDIFRRLFPCLLMSPVSVSQYLDPSLEPSDVAIFDEASQMPTCNAIGVLARANHAIICGDPNQMPPTSFFSSVRADEDHLEEEDLDSILDDALALGLPSLHLDWHYRSRHESLIAFSNREFYENRMLTFPSADYRSRKIECVQTGGTFERGKTRTNPVEARVLVDQILAFYHADPKKKHSLGSIGVVTFNIPQQNLIEDLLAKEASKDPAFDVWMNSSREPLFVKNLENVQGDERDIILFSFTYGPDLNGNISMNFGPINRENGWKRLNVAITRARKQMIVFASLNADQIDCRRTKARGVQALHDFLKFASASSASFQESQMADAASLLAGQLADRFRSAGIECDLNVGMSTQKVDLAIRNPYLENAYCAGILLDCQQTGSTNDVRDRQIGSPSVLKGLGWKLIHFWTIDWWNNPERTWKQLLAQVQEAIAEAPREDVSHSLIVHPKLPDPQPEQSDESADENTSPFESNLIPDSHLQSESASQFDTAPSPETPPFDGERIGEPESETDDSVSSGPEQTDALAMAAAAAASTSFSPAYAANSHTEQASNEALSSTENTERPKAQIVPCPIFTESYAPLSSTEFTDSKNRKMILQTICSILDLEAPIEYELLKKRVLRCYGISRSSSLIDPVFKRIVSKADVQIIKQGRSRFVWRKGQNPDLYPYFRLEDDPALKRSPDQICDEEFCNAIRLCALERPSLT